jgi:ferredoxin-like protein FixX
MLEITRQLFPAMIPAYPQFNGDQTMETKTPKAKTKYYCPACGKKKGIEPKLRRSLETCCECGETKLCFDDKPKAEFKRGKK